MRGCGGDERGDHRGEQEVMGGRGGGGRDGAEHANLHRRRIKAMFWRYSEMHVIWDLARRNLSLLWCWLVLLLSFFMSAIIAEPTVGNIITTVPLQCKTSLYYLIFKSMSVDLEHFSEMASILRLYFDIAYCHFFF